MPNPIQSEEQKAPSQNKTRGTFGLLLLICAAAVLLPILGFSSLVSFLSSSLDSFQELGLWTLVPFVLVASTLIGLALLPSHVSSGLAGFLYGLPLGTLVALLSVMLGACLGYGVTQKTAKHQLRFWIDRSKWTRVLAEELIDSGFSKCLTTIALSRLPPQVPFALGNIVAASSGVSLIPFILGTVLGMAPRIILLVWVGTSLSYWKVGTPIPNSLMLSLVAAGVGFGGIILWSALILKKHSSNNQLKD
ncbi:MAG: VTT domain-containing protein [Verrucomicrobiota bacterium]